MFTQRFLMNKRGVELTPDEKARLESAIVRIQTVPPRTTLVTAGEPRSTSNLLVEGFVSRYIDDRNGLRQLVGLHVPGDFIDLHMFPLKELDHDLGSITTARIAIVPHQAIEAVVDEMPEFARKLWFSTLLDAAIHRAWLFRLGRLDAIGRVAHLFCEMNARLTAVGMSDAQHYALPLTQSDVGEICGLTSVHVNRVLRQLREQGLCAFRDGHVTIHDLSGLLRCGQFDPAYLYLVPETLERLGVRTAFASAKGPYLQ